MDYPRIDGSVVRIIPQAINCLSHVEGVCYNPSDMVITPLMNTGMILEVSTRMTEGEDLKEMHLWNQVGRYFHRRLQSLPVSC